jgi:nitrile hydratase
LYCGVQVFPDTHAQGLGEKRQHVYSVRFAARELWGEKAKLKHPIDKFHYDLMAEITAANIYAVPLIDVTME